MGKYLADGTYIVVPDLQVPLHDRKAVDVLLGVIRAVKPAGLLNVGDEADSPEPSRWNKGYAAEYAATLEAGLVATHDVVAELDDALRAGRRGGFALPHHVMRSNHTDRVERYLHRYAPAVASLSMLRWEALIGYGVPCALTARRGVTLPVTFHRQVWEFAPGWVLAHGDETSMIRTAGGTAMGLAKKLGCAVVAGHTHKLGMQHHHLGLLGRARVRQFGVEVGHLMDPAKADYLKAGHANWQQGFGVLDIRGRHVAPSLVPITDHRAVIGGRTFGPKGVL